MNRSAALSGCLALALALGGGCRSTPAPAGPETNTGVGRGVTARTKSAEQTMLVQVLHRAARLPSGELDMDAPKEMIDAAVAALTGRKTGDESWNALVGRRGRKIIVGLPSGGPVAQAVRERLLVLTGDPDAVQLTERTDDDSFRARAVVLVVSPQWEQGSAGPDARATSEALSPGLRRSLVLVLGDLTTPTVNSEPWRADEIFASRSPACVSLAARYVLAAHAAGAVPDGDRLAAELGLQLEHIDWRRLVLTNPPGRLQEIYATERKK